MVIPPQQNIIQTKNVHNLWNVFPLPVLSDIQHSGLMAGLITHKSSCLCYDTYGTPCVNILAWHNS